MSRSYLQRLTLLGTVLAAAVPNSSRAQARELFRWAGTVDHEVQLIMRGQNITVRNIGPNETGRAVTRLVSELPRRDGQVVIDLINGRGVVDVIQQPGSTNDFTTILRIRDTVAGPAQYQFNTRWEATAAGNVSGPPYGRARGVRRPPARTALQWSGEIDDDTYIRVRTDGVSYSTVTGLAPRLVEANFVAVPRGEVKLVITDYSGRGEAYIAQQPMASNGYVAVIRVRDPQSGYGPYSFNVTW
jgi:hypothetical protein